MKKAIKLAVIAALLTVVAVSCTTVSFQGIQAQKDLPAYTVVGQFEKVITDPAILGNAGGIKLIPLGDADERIFTYIQDEITKWSGDAAINVTIEYQATFVDILLNALTAGIYAPSHIVIKGTVVNYN